MLVLGRSDTAVSLAHRRFFDLPEYLKEGDCLVLNNTRVIPARLRGLREDGGAAELLLLEDCGNGSWEALAKPGRRIRPGTALTFGNGLLTAIVTKDLGEGRKLLHFEYEGVFSELLSRFGELPLPPYITKKPRDSERYQTVYSTQPGSAAAPTAGLHFTPELLERLRAGGVRICEVTLHVGLGTFRPVQSENIEEHVMHSERFFIPAETADTVLRTKRSGGRVVAVGTTACRTLESAAASGWENLCGSTSLFITPGYRFRAADALVTNFHLPESTLIMLVSALAGRENVLAAYAEAVRERYRFFSFGDAMLII